MHRTLIAVALLAASLAASASDLGNQFVKARLAYGASIDIPRSWKVMRGNELRAIEATVGAAIDLTSQARAVEGTESLLVSNFPDPKLYAGVTVTTTAIKGSTRSSVAALTDAQVKSGESTIRQGMDTMLTHLGARTWAWTPLEKVSLGDTAALHISYLRSSDAGDRRVHVYKVFGTGRIYDVVVSTSVDNESMNRIILTRIATSFKAP